MCEPTTIIAGAAFALQVGSTVAGAIEQNNASKENKQAALRAERETDRQLTLRQQQEQDSSALVIKQTEDAGRSAVSVARASAAEAGVAGASVEALYADLERDTATQTMIQRTNLAMTVDQLQQEKRNARTNAQSRINNVPTANPYLAGLQIGAAGLAFAGQMTGRSPSKATATDDRKPASTRSPNRQRGPSE